MQDQIQRFGPVETDMAIDAHVLGQERQLRSPKTQDNIQSSNHSDSVQEKMHCLEQARSSTQSQEWGGMHRPTVFYSIEQTMIKNLE